LLKLLGYFWGPIPWMIEVAAVLSAMVGHWVDMIIVLVLLVFNVVVGFWQEHQFVPFDPVHKRTEAEVQGSDGKSFKVTKGAPPVILDPLDELTMSCPKPEKSHRKELQSIRSLLEK
jgi:magnesium-transporting ATPase (P-type)